MPNQPFFCEEFPSSLDRVGEILERALASLRQEDWIAPGQEFYVRLCLEETLVNAAKQGSGTLRLCSLSKDIRKVFEITNLDKHFIIYEDAGKGVKRHRRSLDVEAEERAWDQGSGDA